MKTFATPTRKRSGARASAPRRRLPVVSRAPDSTLQRDQIRKILYGPRSEGDGGRPGTRAAHVVQQMDGARSYTIQRAGDPRFIPTGFGCTPDLSTGRPPGTDVVFSIDDATITSAHTRDLTTFRTAWLAAGGTDDIVIHGYASTDGGQTHNWTLSCSRARAVERELHRLGIPPVRIRVVAHGESTDFGPLAANRHAVVSSTPAGPVSLPLVGGQLTPRDNFAGRAANRFGVGEVIDLDFWSLPPTPATGFGGLQWHLARGGGTLTGVTAAGTGTYTAPDVGGTATLELRVASGATAGRVVSSHSITIVAPTSVQFTVVPGSGPAFAGWGAGTIAVGTWGVGGQGNQFILPRDVSYQGVAFSEGATTATVTGSFLAGWAGDPHHANPQGTGAGGNSTTGTPLTGVGPDGMWLWGGVSPTTILGITICGNSTYTWPIPWRYQVGTGTVHRFATVNHVVRSSLGCSATLTKAGIRFCRNIDGTTC